MTGTRSTRPIIILGAARSGTKFLRETLAASQSLAATRFDLNFVWRTNNESFSSDALTAEQCDAKTACSIAKELRLQAGMSANGELRLLEKTVSNTLRVGFVSRVFPDADFVHIVRDGRDVTASSINQWSKPTDWSYIARKARSFSLRHYRYALWFLRNRLSSDQDRKSVWGVRYPGIEDDIDSLSVPLICARQWCKSVASVKAAEKDNDNLRLIEIRYEKLIESEEAIAGLGVWLKLPDVDRIIEYYRNNVRRGATGHWQETLPTTDREILLEELRPTLNALGYN